ncbi:MAG: bifunctional aspartate kinase/homoserine dehydrogenase I [Oligoflexia bacterium]|nr:bifunctional aspartate kinase/homoserine dehydrogenase I [Oligoflexia bacterium]
MKKPWVVHKFGGTSVGNAERYRSVSGIIASLGTGLRRGIVVSAMKGVTDGLIRLVEAARLRDPSFSKLLEELRARHVQTIGALLLAGEAREGLLRRIEADFKELEEVLRGVWLVRSAADRIIELVSGYGEVWSAQILDALLREQGQRSAWLDAREVLVVEPQELSVTVDWEASTLKLEAWLAAHPEELLVITGFVASTREGLATTLKRNGSDFSASIFGALLEAREVVIWTDVDGVLSADPRLVPEAVVLEELSYHEVTELAYFGAKVVHPATMEPAIRRNIPIWIRNSFNPAHPGTKIHAAARSSAPIQGFSAILGMALVNVEGTGMMGVPGVAERLFGALRSAGISVVMISQASSEHSICLAIPEAQADAARKALEQAFYAEIDQGLIQEIGFTRGCGILAAVGDTMARHPGVAGRFFASLGRAGINVRAIAQGSSERNISAVIDSAEATRALRAAHAGFFLSSQTLSVGLVGTGLIGSAFLKQLERQLEWLRRERRIDIRVRAVMNSTKLLVEDRAIALGEWKDRLQTQGVAADPARFAAHVRDSHIPHAVIIDATASADIAGRYPEWLDQGIHVITPNKRANAAPLAAYRELHSRARARQRQFLYSTNVGAGLPLLQTLRELHQTGDRILAIEGVLSGTLSYIFNSFTGERPFSEIVREARRLGLTEPDPREDLAGLDVARKLVILGREIGLGLELEDVQVRSLVPEELRAVKTEEFLARLAEHDVERAKELAGYQAQGLVPRYVGRIDSEGRAKVELVAFPRSHPFARVQGSDNIVAFRTERYDAQPLVIQGPGAGPEVTAAGVFSDLLRLASSVGAAP